MSASEKLKQYGRDVDAGLYPGFDLVVAALPQIVAVIEAAERHEANGFAYYGLSDALDELEKALS